MPVAGGDDVTRSVPPLPAVLVTGWAPYPAETAQRLADRAGLEFSWERELGDGSGWEPAGDGLSYTPGDADLGRRLRLLGRRPGSTGPAELCLESASPVRPGPGPCPGERGLTLTTEPLDARGFRLVTYNMLADYYVQYYRGQGVDYLPPLQCQDIEYRKQGLLLQLLGYHADVLCLQEVDHHLFDTYWQPMLEAAGYGGTFAIKRGPTDGLATFWSDKFSLVSSERQVIADLASGGDPLFADVQKALDATPALHKSLAELPQVLQLTVLEERTPAARSVRRLLIANVHLYWNEETEHLRALQVGVCLRHIERRLRALDEQGTAGPVTLVFCGDFNSQPHQSICRLMNSGTLVAQEFNTCAEEDVSGVTFSHQYQLASAYGAPEVTSYTSLFTGTLDHIFYMADRLTLEQVVPLPTPEEVRAEKTLPTERFPSDHLALTADFRWLN